MNSFLNKPIVSELRGSNDIDYLLEYHDASSFDHLDFERCKQCYGVCFDESGKMVIGFGGQKKGWGLVGGSIEKGETLEQTLKREIREESNMEVLSFLPVGYQKVTEISNGKVFFQLRYACLVRPYGEFVIDGGDGMSDKGIIKIKLIDPETYREYFDWGKIGERIMERALQVKPLLLG